MVVHVGNQFIKSVTSAFLFKAVNPEAKIDYRACKESIANGVMVDIAADTLGKIIYYNDPRNADNARRLGTMMLLPVVAYCESDSIDSLDSFLQLFVALNFMWTGVLLFRLLLEPVL